MLCHQDDIPCCLSGCLCTSRQLATDSWIPICHKQFACPREAKYPVDGYQAVVIRKLDKACMDNFHFSRKSGEIEGFSDL